MQNIISFLRDRLYVIVPVFFLLFAAVDSVILIHALTPHAGFMMATTGVLTFVGSLIGAIIFIAKGIMRDQAMVNKQSI